MLIFHWFFYVFGSSKAAGTDPSTDPAQPPDPPGRIQESFFPLEEPYSETLLGNNEVEAQRLAIGKFPYLFPLIFL